MKQIIIGAGYAGLIAACHFKDADILEAGKESESHRALLRFRDQSVSSLTGIPFREVRVHKGIFMDGRLLDKCNIQAANLYSRKVTGVISGRSIWNLDPVNRYIAPDDFYSQLVNRHRSRIRFQTPINNIAPCPEKDRAINFISTIPLGLMASIAQDFRLKDVLATKVDRAAIRVDRYRLPACDVYQTIYFPEPWLRISRASITGGVLIVESSVRTSGMYKSIDEEVCECVLPAFGLGDYEFAHEETVDQKYGKIIDLPADIRHAALYELTRDYGVYSLGRFATWRNILLDDVAHDIKVVDSLVNASEYGRFRSVNVKE